MTMKTPKTALAFMIAVMTIMIMAAKGNKENSGYITKYRPEVMSQAEEEKELQTIVITPEEPENDILEEEITVYTEDHTIIPEPTSEIAGIFPIPGAFYVKGKKHTYTGTKTYESTDKITYGVPGEVNRAASPDEDGFMMLNGRYLVAIGTAFGIEPGQYFDITLNNGTVIPCIMGDTKADCDTDESNMFTVKCKCATEFIVKISAMSEQDKLFGDCSRIKEGWDEKVILITALDQKWDGSRVEAVASKTEEDETSVNPVEEDNSAKTAEFDDTTVEIPSDDLNGKYTCPVAIYYQTEG